MMRLKESATGLQCHNRAKIITFSRAGIFWFLNLMMEKQNFCKSITEGIKPKTGGGGRMPGSKNERIDYREIRERSLRVAEELGDTPVAEIIAIKGEDYIGESLNALGEALGVFLQAARAEKDPEKRIGYYQNVVAVADKLAPYRYSRLASTHNSGSDKKGVLERVGVVEREEYEKLMAEIRAHQGEG